MSPLSHDDLLTAIDAALAELVVDDDDDTETSEAFTAEWSEP